jgi:DNA (cytosine-5)-methyltransferase 1
MFDSLTLFPLPAAHAAPIDPRPLIVDSFAGGGGASTGIEIALGRGPDIAINHSESALALHAANHPETLHLSENVYRVDPLHHMHGRHIGLMWFSPDCKHFSKAKGGAPVKRNIRDLAWIIPGWIERIQKSGGRVDVVLLENVEEFKTWGPLIETDKGLMPDPARSGETFQAWCKALRKLGGKIEMRELRACDYGAPTIRKRLFVVVRFDRQRIVWPKPTHGAPDSPEVRAGKLLPWRTAAECIDWSLPCPSIFDTAPQIMAKHGLRAQRPLADNTLARVARGMKRYVLEADRPFIVNLTHGGRLENAAEPFRTITAAHRGEKAVVVPSIVGCGGRAGQSRPRGGDEPFATVTAKADACMVAASITRFNGGATGADLCDPMPTITANSWIKKPGGAMPLGLLTPYLASIAHGYSGGRREYPLTDPLGTVTVSGIQHAVLAPHLLSLKGSARRDRSADTPHATVLAGGGHSAIIAPVLTYAQQGGGNRPASDPHHTICASRKDQNSLIAATMVHIGNGERQGQQPRALDIEAPLNTVVASGVRQYPVAAFLAQQNGGPRMEAHNGRDAREPISTVTGSGSHQTPIAAFFAKYYGTGDGARSDEPCHTITVKDRMGHIQADLAAPPFGPEHHDRAREVAEFLRAHGAWDGGEYVTLSIDGQDFVVVDIGMRMLTPRELFNAQGFPPDYVIEGVWTGTDTDHPKWNPFPGHVQVSCCGNSVCPPLAEALVRANCGHLAVEQIRGAA